MNARDLTFLVAAVGNLALALGALSRAGKSALGLPVSLLAFDFFGWTFGAFCHHQLGAPLWRAFDVFFTALGPAVVLHVVLAFVGARRRFAGILALAYGAFGLLGGLAFVAARFVETHAWSGIFLAAWMTTLAWELVLLVRHLRRSVASDERARARLVLLALAVGAVFASTDVLRDLGAPIPPLAPIGTLLSTALFAVVALRLRLFERNVPNMTALYAAAIAATAVLLYLALFEGLRGELPALTFGATVITCGALALVRDATRSAAAQRERIDRLAVLGRFSAQMAHDLKNPLSALVGAVQALDGEGEMHELIVEQAARIRAIVERYDRLGRVEPVRSRLSVDELVRGVARSMSREVEIHVEAAAGDGEIDPDLVRAALENLLRNAIDGGAKTITVRAWRDDALALSVADDGQGMDARAVERAFDDFFTTKPGGSGLGLAFVRRVALAHGGDATLTSKPGVGTLVELRMIEP